MRINIGLTVLAVFFSFAAQKKTLRERVIEKQGPIHNIVAVDGPDIDFTGLVHKADVILRGHIAAAKVHLSPDQMWVLTTFTLLPTEVLVDHAQGRRKSPSLSPRYQVTILGGEMQIEGFLVSNETSGLPLPSVNDEVVLFLEFQDELQSWVLLNGRYGIYHVKPDGRIESRVRRQAAHGKPVGEFLSEIRGELSSRSPTR